MTIWIYSGKRTSNSAEILSKTEGFRRMRLGKLVKNIDTIINWGVSNSNKFLIDHVILNRPDSVAVTVNKLESFKALTAANVMTVPWTTNILLAREWQAAGQTIVCRKILTGSAGNGIIIISKNEELLEVPLYSRYIFKTKEFRVHATTKKVLSTSRKIRDPNKQVTSWKIRSHDNGFIFQHNNIQPDEKRDELAIQAIKALNLDFGAVDIIEDKQGQLYVLEVNTAPGLEGQTVQVYIQALKELSHEAHS